MIGNTKKNLKKILPFVRPHIKEIILGLLCMFIYVGCWPLLARQAGLLIPAIGAGKLNEVIEVTIIALIVFLIQKSAQFAQDIILAKPSLYISQKIRNDLFYNLQKLKLISIEKQSTGDITYRLTEDADRIGEVIYKTIQDTTPCILQLLAVFGYMVFIDLKLSIATLLLAPIIVILISIFGSKVMSAAERSQERVSELAGLITEAIQGLPLVRSFAVEDWMQERFESRVELHRKAKFKTLRLLALQHPVVGFIEATGILSVLAIGAARIQSGELNAQGFSSYMAALLMLIDPISHLTANFNEFKQGQASLKRLNEIASGPKEYNNPTNNKLTSPIQKIEFKAITFSYNKENKVLNNINLSIKCDEITALVGPSGAGKTTLFSLLLRFIEPDYGQILFDDKDINDFDLKNHRRILALVPQRLSVFSGSIFDSINFGRDYSLSDVKKAAIVANAHSFIKDLPEGYNTLIKERATNISGGQLQRIAIARAILGNPSILLLDEATSALDAEAEEAVKVGVRQAMNNRTVFIIAHKLSTVQEADKIVVLDNGNILDIGTHTELISKDGKYRELCEKQFIKQV